MRTNHFRRTWAFQIGQKPISKIFNRWKSGRSLSPGEGPSGRDEAEAGHGDEPLGDGLRRSHRWSSRRGRAFQVREKVQPAVVHPGGGGSPVWPRDPGLRSCALLRHRESAGRSESKFVNATISMQKIPSCDVIDAMHYLPSPKIVAGSWCHSVQRLVAYFCLSAQP